MCGLVGAIGQIDYKTEKAFKQLLVLDSLRGVDSTGAAIVNRGTNNEPTVVKAVGNPFELLDSTRFERAMKGVHRVMIGHNRFATQGSVNSRNAHPFDFEDIVGAHNGTLHNKYVLDSANDFAVDSQALFNHINKFGVESAIKNLNGAWALTWWQKSTSTMHFLRNKERTLFLCESNDGKQTFWASESWMLTVALGRNEIPHTTPYLLQEDTLVSVKIAPSGEFLDEEIKEWVKSEYVPFVQGNTIHGQFGNQQHGRITQQNSAFNTQKDKPKDNIVQMAAGSSQVSSAYAGKKGRVLKALSFHKDSEGGGYFQAFDKEYPGLRIRLYVNKGSVEMDWLGKEFIGDIEDKPHYRDNGLFHKVIHSSTKLFVKPLVLDPPEEEEKLFPDSTGRMIDEKNWKRKYGTCCVCSGVVDPESKFRFAKGHDETLCYICMDDKQITEYMGI